MPLRDLEVPGLVPDADGSELSAKQARRHRYQRGRRQRRWEEKLPRKERSWVDRDRCLGMMLFYFSQTRGRMRKPDSRARIRANGQTGPSGGTAAFRGWLVRRDGQSSLQCQMHKP